MNKALFFNEPSSGQESVSLSLKKISYCFIIIPLIMVIAKIVFCSNRAFHIIDPEQKLKKRMVIKGESICSVERLLPEIIDEKKEKDIKNEVSIINRGNNIVFSLKKYPHIVFKSFLPNPCMQRNGKQKFADRRNQARFNNMIFAQRIRLIHNLKNLVIPHATVFTIRFNHSLLTCIAEERLDFEPSPYKQANLYADFYDEETISQMVTFIEKTGFNDIIWRNIPLLPDEKRIALIDLEHLESAKEGLLGSENNKSIGFIRCLSEKGMKRVIEIALKDDIISNEEADSRMTLRQKKLRIEEESLRKFYKRHKITKNNQCVNFPNEVNTSNFSKKEVEKYKILAFLILDMINKYLIKQPFQEPIQKQRYLTFTPSQNFNLEQNCWRNVLVFLKNNECIFDYTHKDNEFLIQA